MNIACASCPAKYAVPDDKVRGRKVRITCKRCGAAIIVDGTSLGATGSPGTAERPVQQTIAGGTEAPADQAPPPSGEGVATGAAAGPDGAAASRDEQQVPAHSAAVAEAAAAPAPAAAKAAVKPLAAAPGAGAKPLASVAKQAGAAADAKGGFPKPGGAGAKIGGLGKAASTVTGAATASAGATATQAARSVAVPRAAAAVRAVAPSALPERTWTVAVTDDDHREMTLAQLVDAYAAETIDAETFVWRDGMQDWLMPFEIAEIAAALRARRLSPRTNAAAFAAPAGTAPPREEPAGTWREPGRWDRDDPAPDEPNFDDVTVAMEAPKAKALLQAVTSSEDAAPAASVSKNDEPTTVGPPLAVTPALLGFGLDDEPAPKAAAEDAAAGAPSEEREPAKLPFDLAPSATPARAALKASAGGTAEPRDLFARGASRDDAADEPKDAAAAKADWDPIDSAVPEPGAVSPALTGARNESSVLFSLDQLTKADAKPAPSPKKKREEAALLLGGSTGAAADIAPAAGGLFGQTHMAAPDFTAPPPPSVPPPAQRKSTSGAPASAAPKAASGTGKWVGLVVGLAVVGGGAFFLSRSPTPPTAPSATAVAATAAAPTLTASAEAPLPLGAAAASSATENPAGATSVEAAPGTSAAPGASTTAGSAAPTGSASAVPSPGATAAPIPGVPATPRPQATAAPKPSAATEPAPAEGPDFDKDAASAALATAAARAEGECGAAEGPHGTGKVSVTFVNSGRATNALVSGDFAGSALGGCVARIFRGAKVPAFGGESVRVSKTVRIP
jgi:predicted Zn finger-like uncharacterized protein